MRRSQQPAAPGSAPRPRRQESRWPMALAVLAAGGAAPGRDKTWLRVLTGR
jgi:hypothetical protein